MAARPAKAQGLEFYWHVFPGVPACGYPASTRREVEMAATLCPEAQRAAERIHPVRGTIPDSVRLTWRRVYELGLRGGNFGHLMDQVDVIYKNAERAFQKNPSGPNLKFYTWARHLLHQTLWPRELELRALQDEAWAKFARTFPLMKSLHRKECNCGE